MKVSREGRGSSIMSLGFRNSILIFRCNMIPSRVKSARLTFQSFLPLGRQEKTRIVRAEVSSCRSQSHTKAISTHVSWNIDPSPALYCHYSVKDSSGR